MTVLELICEILDQYSKAFGGGIPKTKLLKLAYLVEVMYKRKYMERITEADWVYYLYGPYLFDYDNILESDNLKVTGKESRENKEFTLINLMSNYHNDNIPADIKFFIGDIIRDYGKWELPKILEYVYFETEPMINAENRRETLNFDYVLPEEYYNVKKLKIEPKVEKQILQELRKKSEALRGKRSP